MSKPKAGRSGFPEHVRDAFPFGHFFRLPVDISISKPLFAPRRVFQDARGRGRRIEGAQRLPSFFSSR